MNIPQPSRKLSALSLLFASCVCLSLAVTATAQKREHLTPEEIELIRENQELDLRTGVFIKDAERRLLAVTNPAESEKNAPKEKEKGGVVEGSRTQLFYDISKILEEAVVNVDDLAEHNRERPLLRKALYMLAEASNKMMPELSKLREAAQTEAEANQLERALE